MLLHFCEVTSCTPTRKALFMMDPRDNLPSVPRVAHPASGQVEKKSRWIYVEDAVIILAILSLWPIVLGEHSAWSTVLLCVALAALVVIFFARLNRIKSVARDLHRDEP